MEKQYVNRPGNFDVKCIMVDQYSQRKANSRGLMCVCIKRIFITNLLVFEAEI